ncbi:sn-glycerol-3-phosphate import ATP-binding protein UgpC [Pirellulimonas nuda]|uniref:sn-glycerol-3-phosphate import ATP-binding protein UgpC n=1 Tax=Pirellulimonas nuda TaxID=2528009 RepID=A0A518DFI6_9BACT|nr:sn-glycerol-3-phosphate ABC transporter ATP-binding protein UgpC [Pirellulimonas nuda]QDU90239.1 sn-glycerol-3-phosphate import ATP-binding protein UgpC [Pirellulimonas nuda]
MACVRLTNLNKHYPGFHAVRDISVDIADGEFVVLVGPSGCGKSTTLRMIAGLEEVTSGDIFIGDRRVNDVAPAKRDVAMVFQNYALYPHMTVRKNLSFGLRMRRTPRPEIESRVAEASAMLGLDALLDRRPKELSGGQRQRVALGRAIVRQPQVFLFDEPLSNLDAKLRSETRTEIAALHRRLGTTMIYVTHDQVEAMTLGDRLVLMRDGVVQQAAPPLEVYHRPANRFVAAFIGSPAMNLFPGGVRGGQFRPDGSTNSVPMPGVADGPAVLGVRPEDLLIDGSGMPLAEGSLYGIEQLGHENLLHLNVGPTPCVVRTPLAPPGEPPARVRLSVGPGAVHLFAADDGGRRLA